MQWQPRLLNFTACEILKITRDYAPYWEFSLDLNIDIQTLVQSAYFATVHVYKTMF